MTTAYNNRFPSGRSITEVIREMLLDENYPDVVEVLSEASTAFLEGKEGNAREAVREFLYVMLEGGFYVSYKPEIRKEDIKYGTVKWYDYKKAFGFIIPDDGPPDVYISESLLIKANLIFIDNNVKSILLRSGERVEYVPVVLTGGRLNAKYIRVLDINEQMPVIHDSRDVPTEDFGNDYEPDFEPEETDPSHPPLPPIIPGFSR